jgi:hypothetical protein
VYYSNVKVNAYVKVNNVKEFETKCKDIIQDPRTGLTTCTFTVTDYNTDKQVVITVSLDYLQDEYYRINKTHYDVIDLPRSTHVATSISNIISELDIERIVANLHHKLVMLEGEKLTITTEQVEM